MGLKRKSKSNDTLFGSDDDEPIGTLLKLKGRKISKKTKASVDGDQNKGEEVEKMAAEEEELGGMDDTLANFRKKLRGTKKVGGSVVAEGKDTSSNVVEPLCESRTESAKRIGFYPNLISGLQQKDQGNTEAGSSGDVTVIDGLKAKSKIKNKRVKISSDTKVFGRNFEFGDGLDHQISENCALEQDIEGAAESGDEVLEDSLFSFFQKAQSGMISKSHGSRLKQERETTVSDDGSIPYSAIVSEAPVGKYQSASKLEKFPLPGDSLPTAPGQGSISSTLSCRSVDDRLLESLDCKSGSSVTKQGFSSTPLKTGQIGESTNNLDSVVKVISGNSASISMVPKSPSSLRACSTMNSEVLGGTVISEAPGDQPGLRTGSSNILHRTYEVSCCVETGDHPLHTFQEPILDKKCGEEDRGDDLDTQLNLTTLIVPDRETELSTSLSESQKTGDDVKQVWGRDTDGHPMYVDEVQHHSSHYPVDRLQKDLPSGGHDNPFRSLGNCSGERDPSSVSSQEKGDHISEYRSSSPVAACENLKYEVPFQMNRENEFQNIVDESEQVLEPSLIFQEGASLPNFDYPSGDEEVNGTSYSTIMMDQGSCPEDRGGSFDDPEAKESCRSVVQRAARNTRKLRHGDMAYEGDVDWEVLMQGQEFFVSHEELDKTKEKFNASFMPVDAENGKAAAVSVGLKARAVGPIEKIKFKEVLKRKGGLQEYLECRNHILSVWNKDVSRILRLSDFGVSDAYLVGESPRASLVRDIYIFLDQRGYINFGVPFEKKKAENYINHDLKLLPKKLGEHFGLSTVDSENVDPVVFEKQKSSETCIGGNNENLFTDEKQAEKLETEDGLVNLQAVESSVPSISEDNSPDRSKIINDLEHMGSIPLHEDKNGSALNTAPPVLPSPCEAVSAFTSELPKAGSDVLSSSMDCAHSNAQCYAGPRKTIIIIGAGPAGLAAARHLQRQGFIVTVLEARTRIGGRVYTDHSSLSVPVDLGASIITGVEADVDTERRPDPSSLICAQLGLKLTVLNSECPLYDTVTRQKVPTDLDEAVEAEYNSLLDDTELLVAEKGEPAMNMSLEEGLEYALKRRSSSYGMMPVKSLNNSVAAEGFSINDVISSEPDSKAGGLSPLERRIMDWHFAHLEYGCAALLKEVSLPNWNQDDLYGGFGGAHCMIKGGYSAVIESLREGICVHLDHVVKDITYNPKDRGTGNDLDDNVKVCTSNGKEFTGDAVLVTVPLGCLKADTIKFSPPLPQWKYLAIKRLGFGVLNKVILEFPEVFWDDSVDYFGATAEETDQRGRCFMFWNVKKTVGAPVLVALLVGKAAVDGQNISSSDHVAHALCVLRKVFGEDQVLDPVASVVTDWGNDPYSYGAYSYVAVGSSGEDYDTLGRPVNNCIFFAGEATCKEHPDTVGGAMMSGLREAVRIADILNSGTDYTAEVEAMEAAKRHSNTERSEVKDIARKLDAIEFSGAVYTSSLDGSQSSAWGAMLKDMFFTAKTTAGRLHLAKELLNLPVGFLKTFAATKEGLSTLNSWILDSMGKDGTQLLRHCVRLLVLVSNDLLAVRLSGVGKTVKEKVCVHTSRDIRAIASQLVKVWVDLFRKEKAAKGGHTTSLDPKGKSSQVHGRPPLRTNHVTPKSKKTSKVSASAGYQFSSSASTKKVIDKSVKLETRSDLISDVQPPNIHGSTGCGNNEEESCEIPLSEEEKAAFAVAEAARSAAIAAAKAYASSGAMHNTMPQLPKILSFNKFAMREQYTHMDDPDSRKNWSGAAIGKPDCFSEIDSRNCRVRDWAVDFSAAGVDLENSKMPADNHSQRSHSNEVASHLNFREHSGESVALDNNILTKAWVDSSGSIGLKDYNAIERWQCQAAAASSGFSHETRHIIDEEESNLASKLHEQKHDAPTNGSSDSQVITNRESKGNQSRGAEHIKQAVVDYVASLLMPLYKARKIDKEGYKLIMKKTATKVMERATDAEKAMAVIEFLDFKRKNKIRAFVDMMIERHLAMKPDA